MAGSSKAPLRTVSTQYKLHDGFTNHIPSTAYPGPSGSSINLHVVAANPDGASREDMRELRDAVQRRQFVEDIMELNGTYFPGLDAIKQQNEAAKTSDALKERIQTLQQKHVDDVRTLYEWQAQDYHDEVLALSRSRGDIDDKHIDSLYQCLRSNHIMELAFDDALDRHYHAHLTAMQALYKQRSTLQKQEEIYQARQAQQFPSSVAEFHAIRNKDVQLRIARFLTADESVRDRMMDEFKWVYRQVKPLVTEFELKEGFRAEIERLLRDVEVRDPRRAKMMRA